MNVINKLYREFNYHDDDWNGVHALSNDDNEYYITRKDKLVKALRKLEVNGGEDIRSEIYGYRGGEPMEIWYVYGDYFAVIPYPSKKLIEVYMMDRYGNHNRLIAKYDTELRELSDRYGDRVTNIGDISQLFIMMYDGLIDLKS